MKNVYTRGCIDKETFRVKISEKNNSCLTEAFRGFRVFLKKTGKNWFLLSNRSFL